MFTRENLLRSEVFPAELPPSFGTETLAACANEAIIEANSINQKCSIPLKYSGYKSEGARRKFAIPNPYHYCKAVDLIVSKEAEIGAILKKSSYSLTAPIEKQVKSHQAYAKKSGSIADTKEEIEKQYKDNRYEIRLDISSFFDSIYTHSISWAIHGIAVAKRRMNDSSLLGNQLDKYVRAMNYNQTNGILVGNAVSRIIAEIILCTIDEAVQKKFPEITCRRFVDDYYIYTRDSGRIQEIISFIRSGLAQYELSFNENKLQINESPFLYGKPWVEEIKQYMHLQPDVFLSKVIMEYNAHKDITIVKYGLKVIGQCKYTHKNWPAMQSRIINLWVRFPSLSDRIFPLLWMNKDKIKNNVLKKAIYSVIEESLLLNREQELVWAVWYAKVFEVTLSQPYVTAVLKSSCDVAIIIMLDYIYKHGLQSTPKIKAQLLALHNKLANEDIGDSGSPNQLMWTAHWLLAYEADRNGWLNVHGQVFNYAQNNPFFNKLLAKNVKFYDTDYVIAEPSQKTKNYEYATRSEMYAALNKLKKKIMERLKSEGIVDRFEMIPDEEELYEEFVRAWEQEESVYVG